MAARFLRHLDVQQIAELEAFVLHPARTIGEAIDWLRARGVLVPQETARRWMEDVRHEAARRQLAAIEAASAREPTPQDVAAKTAAVHTLTDFARQIGEARMLREQDEITPEVITDIATRFRALLQHIGKSEAWASRSVNIPAGTLSQVLSNTYAGDTDSRIRQIDRWIEQQHGKLKAPKPTGFVKTTTAMAIVGAAKIAIEENRIVVVYGPSGCGKTLTAKYLASESPGALYVEITEANKRSTGVLEAIARELRLPNIKMTISQMERTVIETLKGTGRLLIVDEVHTLVTGRSKEEQSLNMLRRIQDQTDCPMVWFGTADLARYLEEGVGIRQGVDQIYGRVAFWLDLATPVLANEDGPGHHTIDDIRKIVAQRELRITPDAQEFLRDMANTPGLGGLRAVDTLLNLVQRRGKDREVTAELLRDMQQQRLGRAAAVRIERRVSEYRLRRVG